MTATAAQEAAAALRKTKVSAAKGKKSEKAKAAPKAKEPKEATVAGHPVSAKIKFGTDGEGNQYSPSKNSPKRAGTKSAELFAKYKTGMSLNAALEAGIPREHITWDLKHGFIEIAKD